jgi:ATP phosphoribosyltransferase-like protein
LVGCWHGNGCLACDGANLNAVLAKNEVKVMAQPLTEFSPIKLGLPMGAMESEVLALMNAADLKVDRLTPHYAIIDDPRVSDGVFSEPRDLWTMVAQGELDAAIVPFDDVAEEMRKRPIAKQVHIEPFSGELLFIAHLKSWQEKSQEMQDILMLLRGAVEARGRVLLVLNVDEAHLKDVLNLLPALRSPTVSPLAEPHMFSVMSVVPRNEVNRLIPELLRAGATDIVELPISKLIRGSQQT